MANKKPTKGTIVIYTPYEDDAQLSGPSTGKIINVHEDNTVDIEFKPAEQKPGVISEASITRQFIPESNTGFNVWKKAPKKAPKKASKAEATPAEKTEAPGEDTGTREKAPENA